MNKIDGPAVRLVDETDVDDEVERLIRIHRALEQLVPVPDTN